jgi:hypothetical protein
MRRAMAEDWSVPTVHPARVPAARAAAVMAEPYPRRRASAPADEQHPPAVGQHAAALPRRGAVGITARGAEVFVEACWFGHVVDLEAGRERNVGRQGRARHGRPCGVGDLLQPEVPRDRHQRVVDVLA